MAKRRGATSSYYWLLGSTIVLLLFGLIMILSASSVMAYAKEGDSYYYLKRQLLWALVGLAAMGIFSRFNYRNFRKLSVAGIILALFCLVLVLIPNIGRAAGGASRWLPLGPFAFQPSEFAKLAIILYVADVLTQRRGEIHDLTQLLVPVVPVVGFASALVILQPDMGTAVAICFVSYVLVFLAGARLRHVFGLGVAGSLAALFFIFSEEYRRQRFIAFLNPWVDPRKSGFQIIQSLLAFGSGGIRGLGFGMSRQKFFYLPAAHTDFIFAIIGEELGLIGTLFVVLMFAVLAITGMRIAFRSRDVFGRLLGSGITCMILSQALINMGAVTGILPVTGIPLPLLSFGGSSLVFTLCGIGILLNIATQEKGASYAGSDMRRGDRRTRLPWSSSGRGTKVSGRRR
ncbi:MAG: putative lipid II flippase FtsW [Actinomycetota bacterium]|nr:putative lipid II flippase FtsW [Actinomycetota bacterium]